MKKILLATFFLTFNLITLAQNSRVFKENIFVESQSFYPSDYDLFRPVIFALSGNESEFVFYDYSQNNLYSIIKEKGGKGALNKIGEGRGSGPKEFRNPTDICVTSQNSRERIIVSDTDLARVSIWDLESKNSINSFKTEKFSPYRLTCYRDKIMVYNSSGSKNGNYLVYDFDGNLVKGIEDNTLSKDSFLDSGYIVADSFFIYFGSEGKPEIKKYN